MKPNSSFYWLIFGTFIGGYLCMRFQFNFKFSSHISEELILATIVLATSFLFVAILNPLHKFIASKYRGILGFSLISLSALILAFIIGLWFYAGFLPRAVDLVLSRDLTYVLSFMLLGVGYAITTACQKSF